MNRPLIVGVAGGSGSGKTVLAHRVADAVGRQHVQVLSMDQYFRTPAEGIDPVSINFDHPKHLDFELMLTHLQAVREGEAVRVPTYDFRVGIQQPASMVIERKPILIVEGLFVLAEPMVKLFDVTCFLDVDADQRLLGRILRDVRERASTVEEIVDRYQRFVRPSYQVFVAPTKQNADIVVDFTYRRILFERQLTMLLSTYVTNRFDLEEFAREMKAECNHLGFTPHEGSMPVTVDILQLGAVFPESDAPQPSMK